MLAAEVGRLLHERLIPAGPIERRLPRPGVHLEAGGEAADRLDLARVEVTVGVGHEEEVEQDDDAGPVRLEDEVEVAHAARRVGVLGLDAGFRVETVEPLDLLDRQPAVGVDHLTGEDEEGVALLGAQFVEKHGDAGWGAADRTTGTGALVRSVWTQRYHNHGAGPNGARRTALSSSPSPPPMTLDVFADIACPWCYIGEANLAEALRQRPHLGVERRWRPFQLQPDLPREGAPRDVLERKFGGAEQMKAAFARTAQAGEAAGLRFDFTKLAGTPNTLDAHRLVLLAGEYDRTWETVEALFEGYFADGRDLNDAADLVAIAEHAGVPGADARALLGDDRYEADVRRSQEIAGRAGISGVPLYLVDGQFALSGAQPPEAFVQALDRAAAAGMEAAPAQSPSAP